MATVKDTRSVVCDLIGISSERCQMENYGVETRKTEQMANQRDQHEQPTGHTEKNDIENCSDMRHNHKQ